LKSTLDREISQLDRTYGSMINDPDKAEDAKRLKEQADALRAERDELVGLKRKTPQTAQPGASGVPTIKNDAGQEMVLKDGKWVMK